MSKSFLHFARNVASNYGAMVASLAIGLLFTPYMLHALGNEAYGLWGAISGVLGYAALADLGLSGAVVKYTAQYQAEGEQEEVNRLVSTALACYVLIGLAIALLVGLVTPLLPNLFKLTPAVAGTAHWVFLLTGLNVALSFPLGVVSNYLLGLRRYDVRNGTVLLTSLLNVGLTVLLLETGWGLVGVTVATVASGLVQFAILLWFAAHRLGQIPTVSLRWLDGNMMRRLLTYGVGASIINICGMISWNSDNVVVGALVGVAAVTPYMVANKLSGMLSRVIWAFLSVLIPTFSSLGRITDPARVERLYLLTLRVVVFLSFPAGLVLIVRSGLLLQVWLNLTAPETAWVLSLLTFAVVAHLPSDVALVALLARARHQTLAWLAVADAALNIALSIIGVHLVGGPGAALGTAITVVLTGVIAAPIIGCRQLGIAPIAHYRVVAKGLAALFVPALLLIFVLDYAGRNWLYIGALGLVAGLIYVGGAAALLLDGAERATLARMLTRSQWRQMLGYGRLAQPEDGVE